MNENKYQHSLLIVVATISILGGFLGGIASQHFNGNTFASTDNGKLKIVEEKVYVEESSVIDTVKKTSPAVVSIVISKDLPLYRERSRGFDDFFFGGPFLDYERDENGEIIRTPKKIGGGSGFIVTKEGLALTNRHVVDDLEADYTVVMSDGSEYPAEVISRDPLNDIALIKIKNEDGGNLDNLPTVELGSSSQLEIGQRVVAIGNALAEYGNSVTTGIISAKGRNIVAGSSNEAENLINLLQTDAAINPGNSGGPLTNLNGEVIGINVAIASGAEGIGFAIPIDDVIPIIDSVKKNGKIVRPFLGIRYIIMDEKKANELKIDVEGGALLTGNEAEGYFAVIPGGPADKAGLKAKDVILEIDGDKITSETNLKNIIATKSPGDKVKLKVWRSGEKFDTEIELEEAK